MEAVAAGFRGGGDRGFRGGGDRGFRGGRGDEEVKFIY